METISFKYIFEFEDGQVDTFTVILDEASLNYLPLEQDVSPPAWAALDNKKCSHCPLESSTVPHCPVAKNIAYVTEHFKDKKSYVEAKITVETEERNYFKETDLQTGLFSIFGLIMASSACPYMDFLKPMARFHMPFSSIDETTIRSSSMYLLRQYFAAKDGKIPDLNLEQLEKHYVDLNILNQGIIERIRTVGQGDSKANAMVTLHSISDMLQYEISSDLSGIKAYFNTIK